MVLEELFGGVKFSLLGFVLEFLIIFGVYIWHRHR